MATGSAINSQKTGEYDDQITVTELDRMAPRSGSFARRTQRTTGSNRNRVADWKKGIEKAQSEARAAILLISADFLASSFIVNNELPPLLKNAKTKGVTIIPVIPKPCGFQRDKNWSAFQSVNPPDEPISGMDENGQNWCTMR